MVAGFHGLVREAIKTGQPMPGEREEIARSGLVFYADYEEGERD